MTSIPLLTKDDFECHLVSTQIDFAGDSPINHALTTVAQEVAQLLRQAYPSQAESSNSTQTTAMLKNEDF